MGSFSATHWLVLMAVMTMVFGSGRLAGTLGDLGKGLRAFKREMAEGEQEADRPRLEAPGESR